VNAPRAQTGLLRRREPNEHAKVAMVELFFDLVFVFAITQLSHRLLEDLSPAGALQTLMLFLAVWWVWICTSWITNFLDPDKTPVRALVFLLMLGGLLLSASLPEAFGSRGRLFAFTFAAMQVGRSVFITLALRRHLPNVSLNFLRVTIWFALAAVAWITGGVLEGPARTWCWGAALLLEYGSAWIFFWVPGLGRSTTTDWAVDGAHLAERCALFVIIALGESILATGATFAKAEWNTTSITAFLVAFFGSVAMWWIYFDTGAERASERIAHSEDPGRQARTAYTYIHLLLVGGIIVCAVADEIILVHPHHAELADALAIVGGPVLYLIGNGVFKWSTNDRRSPPLSHCFGLVLLVLSGGTYFAFSPRVSPLWLGVLTTASLACVATWETLALRSAHGHSPLA
jgi:low temperature requirement protein LtrA